MASLLSPPKIQQKDCYYVLSQSWSRALKYHKIYRHLPLKHVNFWILHGLWLGAKNIPYFTTFDFAISPDYKIPTNEQCLRNLDKVLPNLIEGHSNEDRHKSLYNKHGKCVIYYNAHMTVNANARIVTPEVYLCKAAELAIKYNMGQYLRALHTSKDAYKVGAISEMIQKKWLYSVH